MAALSKYMFFILIRDLPLEQFPSTYALAGDIMCVPNTIDQPGRAGMMRLTYPVWLGQPKKGTVVCRTADVYPLNMQETGLLLGIPTSHDRFLYYRHLEELDEAINLQKGTAVTFQYDKSFTWCNAIILYRGEIHTMGRGIKFGLEILVSQCPLNTIYTRFNAGSVT